MLTTLLCFSIAVLNGTWSLYAAKKKYAAIQAINRSISDQPKLFQPTAANEAEWHYAIVTLKGYFDNQHIILLNRFYHEVAGYNVFTPFHDTLSNRSILVNRGWIPEAEDPLLLPTVPPADKETTIIGLLVHPPGFLFSFFPYSFFKKTTWPLILDGLDTVELSKEVGYPLYSDLLLLSPESPDGFVRDWPVLLEQLMPSKDIETAIQWFFLASAILAAFFFLNLHRDKSI